MTSVVALFPDAKFTQLKHVISYGSTTNPHRSLVVGK